MWEKAEKGESFIEEYNQLHSLCFFSFINLDYEQMSEYSKSLQSTYKNLYAVYSDKRQQIQAQQEEEERLRQEQLRQQRIAAEQARQQRLQAWIDALAAVSNGVAHVNATVNASRVKKQHYNNHSTSARTYTQTTTQSEPNYVRCDHCGGSGTCTRVNTNMTLFKSHCRGTGKCQHCIDGLVTTSFGTRVCTYCKGTAKCYHCKGTGKCSKCHGTGKMKK